jgi:signal transduction histidine kinase/DNA-binding NarL/FixJ family response regulator
MVNRTPPVESLNPLASDDAIRIARNEEERVHMLYRQLPISVTGTMLGVLFLATSMWAISSLWLILSWAALMAVNQAARAWLYWRYRKTGLKSSDIAHAAKLWMLGAATSGILWGAVYLATFPSFSPIHQAVLTIIIFGVAAGAVPLVASHAPSFYAFILPTLLPIVGRNAIEGDSTHVTLALVSLVVTWGVLSFGRSYHRHLVDALDARMRNELLAERLKAQNTELDNARLAAEQASNAKTRFFTAASHDLRQPLHAIGLFVDLLTSRVRNPETRRLVGNIETSVTALESLFDALLDISKIDVGVIRATLVDFDPLDLVERLRGDFEAEAGAKGLRLHLHSGTRGCFVHSDPLLVERILRNLIANAIRYTECGGVLVALRQRGDHLNIEVWDTGIGIAAHHQQAIFEEFFQVGNPERGQDKGLGLGLSIVRRIAKLLEVPVSVRSQPGRGTCFQISLPLTTTPNPVPAPRPAELSGDFTSRLILIIDDDTHVRDGMTALLNNWGAQVVACANPVELATALDGRGLPDMIICDYHLADGSRGADIIAALRKRFGRHIPAVVLTGTSSLERLAEAQVHDYHLLLKPVPPSKLRALINATLTSSGSPIIAEGAPEMVATAISSNTDRPLTPTRKKGK